MAMGAMGGARQQVGIQIIAQNLATGAFSQVATQGSSMVRSLQGASDSLSRIGTTLTRTGRSLSFNLTLPLLLAGGAIYRVGSDFEQAMAKIVGLTSVGKERIDAWRPSILAIATATGIGPQKLAETLYVIASSIEDVDQAMPLLDAAARMSASGMGEANDIAFTLTGVLNAYKTQGLTAAEASDVFTATIRDAAFEADDLAVKLGMVTPTAAMLGVPFADVAGTLAVISKTGQSAAQGVVGLNQVFTNLLKPSLAGQGALEDVGLSIEGIREQIRTEGTIATLQTLQDAFAGNESEMVKLFSNVRSMRAVFGVLTQDTGDVADVMGRVNGSTGALGGAFDAISSTNTTQFNKSMASAQLSMITLSVVLMPIVNNIFKDLVGVLADATAWFQTLTPEMQKLIVWALIGAAALGPIVLLLGTMALALGFVISPIGLVTLAIITLVAATLLWGTVAPKVIEGLDAVRAKMDEGKPVSDLEASLLHLADTADSAFGPAWRGVWEQARGFQTMFTGLMSLDLGMFLSGLVQQATAVKDLFLAPFQGLWNLLRGGWDNLGIDIRGLMETAVREILKLFLTMPQALRNLGHDIIDPIVDSIRDGINTLIALWNRIDISIPPFDLAWPQQGFQMDLPFDNHVFIGVPAGSFHMWDGTGDLFPDFGAGRSPQSHGMYEKGLWEVPRDMTAIVHQGESIVPADFAERLRSNGGYRGNQVTIINNFARGSVRSDDDIREFSQQVARRALLLGVQTAGGVA